ncbi:serine hydrolase domain-containing protein [Azospirillum doebereinerae]|uniref:Class C beta-lactamase-related serine hydrolase n=1 Tax=Azospirillum doebereinerae TaxID=92933 RepID=A0A3S0XKB0_9PROT|nr:serine hydrolase [Azospirillum doebereinerae]MCG5243495.1 beta-lactamase family protein [Azospirillum doebereinerae]RUQ66609.1 class C beta-lactamase-related serine hydrolase [Azospirillum doebereinerae]
MSATHRSSIGRRAVLAAAAAASLGSVLPRGLSAAEAESPGAAGAFDPARLGRAIDRAAGLDQIHGMVIGRHGKVAVAKVFRGPALGRAVNVKSVSKTIVASLAGIALDRGVLPGVDASLADVAPDLLPPGADPRVRAITVAQLLTMQAGLEPTSGPGYGRWIGSRNWVADALGRPFVAEPGERMIYSTGSYHVLGAVLARVSGRSLLSLAREWLGQPLGIDVPSWTRDPQGFFLGGNNMALSPLDLFRFGEMWSRGGVWNGRRVVSAAWAEASWVARTRSPFSGDAYGYGWFLAEANGHRIAYARGYGGQMLYLVPSLGVTVVVTSDPGRPARSDGHVGALNALLTAEIIPAAELA